MTPESYGDLPIPTRDNFPAWTLPHVAAADAAILRDLDAHIWMVSGWEPPGETWAPTRVWLKLRWGSRVSVHVVSSYPSWGRLRRDPKLTGGTVALTRHEGDGGGRICLTRGEHRAIHRCVAPYLESARAREIARIAESRARMRASDLQTAEEDARIDEEHRRKDQEWLAKLSEGERNAVLAERRRMVDRILRAERRDAHDL